MNKKTIQMVIHFKNAILPFKKLIQGRSEYGRFCWFFFILVQEIKYKMNKLIQRTSKSQSLIEILRNLRVLTSYTDTQMMSCNLLKVAHKLAIFFK